MSEKILFTADAFGAFGALSGNLFADEVDYPTQFMDEARRYYANIVGRYGPQVQAVLKKAAALDVRMLCPLHGPIWREDLPVILDKYDHWSRYEPERRGVVLAYASMYGNTENAVMALATALGERGVEHLRVYDISKTHASRIIADAFEFSHLVLASPTYNAGLYFGMEALLNDMAVLNLQGRKVAIIANGSWAPGAHTVMARHLTGMKAMEVIAPPLVLRSSLKDDQLPELAAMADAIAASVNGKD